MTKRGKEDAAASASRLHLLGLRVPRLILVVVLLLFVAPTTFGLEKEETAQDKQDKTGSSSSSSDCPSTHTEQQEPAPQEERILQASLQQQPPPDASEYVVDGGGQAQQGLYNQFVSLNDDAATNNSPLGLAAKWQDADPFLATYTEERRVQRLVLALLYYSTNGRYWRNNQGWLSYGDKHECEWYSKSPPDRVCDESGVYTALHLNANGMYDDVILFGLLSSCV